MVVALLENAGLCRGGLELVGWLPLVGCNRYLVLYCAQSVGRSNGRLGCEVYF